MLIMPISMQAMWRFGQKTGTRWVAVFAVFVAVCMIVYYQKYEGSWEGVGYGLVYVAAAIMISVFSTLTQRATSAHKESQALNAELAAANSKLQEYARQVEQLAAAEERSRLARDLHDSVSQTIFSLTLTAQAARILLDRDPARGAAAGPFAGAGQQRPGRDALADRAPAPRFADRKRACQPHCASTCWNVSCATGWRCS